LATLVIRLFDWDSGSWFFGSVRAGFSGVVHGGLLIMNGRRSRRRWGIARCWRLLRFQARESAKSVEGDATTSARAACRALTALGANARLL